MVLVIILGLSSPPLTTSASHRTEKLRCSDEKPTSIWFYVRQQKLFDNEEYFHKNNTFDKHQEN